MGRKYTAPGKKRYQITLTIETVERFRRLEKAMHMPASTMSLLLDEALERTTRSIEKFREKGSASFADLFHLIGEEFDKIENEEKEEVKNLCPQCGLPLHKFHNCELNPTAEGKKNEKSPRKTKKVEG